MRLLTIILPNNVSIISLFSHIPIHLLSCCATNSWRQELSFPPTSAPSPTLTAVLVHDCGAQDLPNTNYYY